MTDPREDGERPAQPAYGAAGPPPPPASGARPYAPPSRQQYAPPSYGPPYGAPPYGPPGYAQPPYAQPPYAQTPYGQTPYVQPQYGPPQYGSYPPQAYPPDAGVPVPRRRRGLVWGLAAAVVAVVAIAVVVSFTLRTRVLDRSAVERDVAAQFREHEGVAIRLDCADSMALTTGATYRCQGTTAEGERVTLLIRVTDAKKADYTWSEQR